MINLSQVHNYNVNNRCNVVSKRYYMLLIVEMRIVWIEVVFVINVLFNIRRNVKAKIVNVMFVNKSYFFVGIMRKVVMNKIVKYHFVRIWNRKYKNNVQQVYKQIVAECKPWCKEQLLCNLNNNHNNSNRSHKYNQWRLIHLYQHQIHLIHQVNQHQLH